MSANDGGVVALVTGAGRGIGFAASRHLAGQGMTVLLGARNLEKGTRSMKALGLAWMGIPTERFEPTVAFLRDVMCLEEERLEKDFAMIRLERPGGARRWRPRRSSS